MQRSSPKPSPSSEAILSGDEADADGNGRRRRQTRRSTGVESRDFEVPSNGATQEPSHRGEKDKKQRKRSKKSKRKVTVVELVEGKDRGDSSVPGSDRLDTQSVKASAAPPRVNIIPEADEVSELSPKRPFHLRDLSLNALPRALSPAKAPQPAGTTTNFLKPNRLVLPTTIRRTNSMPEMSQSASSPILGPVYIPPLPHLMPSNQQISAVDTKDSHAQKPLSRTSAILLLLVVTATVSVSAEFLINSIDVFVKETGVSQAFIGLIILPIVGNAAEHVTAVTVASKNKMDLAIGVALGSSIQIAIFVTPLIVLLGWGLDKDMSLYFSLFETISLFASAFIVNYLMIDGRSNYLEGALLIAAYVIIALAAFFYPSCEDLSEAGGYGGGSNCR
jgi:Ca2+:H+ antiporter